MLENCSCNKTTTHWGVETPNFHAQRRFFFSQGGKISGNCLFKAVWSAGRGKGDWRKKSEKEVEKGKEGGRGKEKPGDREDKKRKDEIPSRASSELNRAEPSRVVAELRVGWLGPDQGFRREGEKEREERGLAAWVVQMGGTRHK